MSTSTIEQYRARIRELVALLNETTSKLSRAEWASGEPIAIIGLSCRFPAGGTDPASFWRALEAGVDGVVRIPAERWSGDAIAADNLAGRWAGLLGSFDTFDPAFFGISPREAIRMDPQQRLLLEVAYEALENAGQPVDRIMGAKAGVFVGFMGSDYGRILCRVDPLDMYTGIGNASSVVAGRLSYILGLQGPSMIVDTACSSSLVAIHLACQSLRNQESDFALAGGVNAILDPLGMAMTAEIQALAPDGRCKTFDATANGFVRGEGCGVVVLKRLSDAQRDGDPILAVIRGSVVNQDGRSTGMTAPNVLSQQAMLRKALEVARLVPEDIGYVETHGTGTSLGDPIEFDALREVLGAKRANGSTCVLGALKTNVGHMEAAAGIGGLIKAILCLQHEAIPKNLHFKTLNPRMSLEGTPFVIPTETIPWKSNGKPRRAGVSAFGISGTNAHVILEEAPVRAEKPIREASSYLLPLSAKTPEALSAMAKSYQEWFAHNDENLHHVAYTASLRRSHLEHRLSVVGSTKEEIAALLGAFAAGENPPGIVTGKTTQSAPKVVFVFPGQGSQWVGMGRQLSKEEPAFRDALAACDEAIRKEAGFSVMEELDKPEETSHLSEIDVVQPVLFAIEVALAALWRSWGVEPSAVVGHSMGEVAAAFVAGALSIADAAAIICRRSRLLRKVAGQGTMALVELTLPDAEKALIGYEDRLSVAVSNGPRSTVIAGDPAALDEVLSKLERDGVFCRRVKVDVASHSPQMDPLREDLLSALASISPKDARIPMRSTVTGERILGKELSSTYWTDNLRKPVLFSKVIEQWITDGHTIFVEMSPHPLLTPSVEENLREANAEGVALASTRRAQDERQTMLSSLGALFVRGVPVAWKAFFPDGGRVIELPTYPWQRKRYWIESPANDRRSESQPNSNKLRQKGSWLGVFHSVSALPQTRFWDVSLTTNNPFPLSDRMIHARCVAPWSLALQTVVDAARQSTGNACIIEEATFHNEPFIDERTPLALQLALATMPDGWTFSLASASHRADGAETDEWHHHAEGRFRTTNESAQHSAEHVEQIQSRCREIPADALYANLANRGLFYASTLRVVERVWARPHEALGSLSIPTNHGSSEDPNVWLWALLDGAMQILHTALPANTPPSSSLRILGFHKAIVGNACPSKAWALARLEPDEPLRASIVVFDETGRIAIEITDIRLEMVLSDQKQVDLDDPATIGRIVRDICCQVTGGGADIDIDAPLNAVGIDSLMTVQLFRKAEQALGIAISTKAISRSGVALQMLTLRALTDALVSIRRQAIASISAIQHAIPPVSSDEEDALVVEVERIERDDDVPHLYRALLGTEIPLETFIVTLSSGERIEVLCAGSGAPLLLLPPIMASIPIWVFQIEAFWRHYRVIVPNYPGYGRSTTTSKSLSPALLARRIAAVLDGFGIREPIHLVGWSLGGLTGQEFVLAMPNRIRSLALVNTIPHLEEEDSVRNMEDLLQRLRQDLNNIKIEQSEQRTMALDASGREATFAQSFNYLVHVLQFDTRDRIHGIAAPTLVVQGLQDTVAVPRYGRFMHRQIPGAQYHESEQGGHFVPLHLPHEFNELLRAFLERHSF